MASRQKPLNYPAHLSFFRLSTVSPPSRSSSASGPDCTLVSVSHSSTTHGFRYSFGRTTGFFWVFLVRSRPRFDLHLYLCLATSMFRGGCLYCIAIHVFAYLHHNSIKFSLNSQAGVAVRTLTLSGLLHNNRLTTCRHNHTLRVSKRQLSAHGNPYHCFGL